MKKSTLIIIVLIVAALITWGVNEGYIKFRNRSERKIYKTYQKSADKVKSVFGK